MRRRTLDGDATEGAVAIVGMACRAPGAHGVDEYWNLLMEGADAIGDVPSNRFTTDENTDGRMRRGGFVDNVAGFDADFFSISPREAESMDPQQRLLLECVWEAFEDAGQARPKWQGSNTGVFVGTDTSNYWERRHRSDPDVYGVMGGGARSSIAGRVSYIFDLNGPALSIDSACASSLSAVHLASRSIRDGECTAAIAAGVHLILGPWESKAFAGAGMLSPDGHCKFGDADADGFVRSEGIGVLLLRPLADALADGDRVHAVVLGSGSSNDGSGSDLFMSPARSGQQLMLERAYADAGVAANTVAYVEAHGTGTQAGDPVELDALNRVLGGGRLPEQPLLVGSVKSNIGHAEAAAGILGTIKAVLVSKHRIVPANLNLLRPNPDIDWDSMGLRIPTEATELPGGDDAVIGVNAFGVSGTNVHIVLGAAPQTALSPSGNGDAARCESGTAQLLTLSAPTPKALQDNIRFHLAYLGTGGAGSELALADICHTAAVRRTHHALRAAVVGDTHDEMSEALRAILHDPPVRPARTPTRIAFVFPGQGSQWLGMGRDLLDTSPAFREVILQCDSAISDIAGWSLVEALTDESQIWDRIDVVQPALWALEVALAGIWRRIGVTPDVVVGHSMGEVAAACVSGAVTIADGARIMCTRSSAMRAVSGTGGMLVVGAPEREVQHWIDDRAADVVIAVVNSPTATVIAGPNEAVDSAERAFDDAGVFVRRVAVDVASHSPAMDSLTATLVDDLAGLAPSSGETGFFSTVRAECVDGADLDPTYWAANLRNRVRFAETITAIAGEEPTAFVEISPHPLLTSALRECSAAYDGVTVASTVRNQPERDEILRNLADLYSAGAPVDIAELYESGRCVPLPRYPWQRERFWLDDAFEAPAVTASPPAQQIFPVDFDAVDAPYLTEHVLLGSPMIPGTTMIEHARRVAKSILETENTIVRRVRFLEPLLVAAASDTELSFVTRFDLDGSVHCDLIDARGTRFFECSMDAGPGDTRPAAAAPSEGSPVDAAEFHDAAAEGGLDWGPRMRAVQSIVRSPGALRATVVRPASLEDDGSTCHPALLEACLTPLLSILERPGWMVAEGIDRVCIHGCADIMTSHITVRDIDVDGSVHADVIAVNGRNEVMAEMNGVTVRTSAPVAAQWLPDVEGRPETAHATGPAHATTNMVISGELGITDPASGLSITLAGRMEISPGVAHGPRTAAPSAEHTDATVPVADRGPAAAPVPAAPAPAARPAPVHAQATREELKPPTAVGDVDVLDLLLTRVSGTLRKPKSKLSADSRARDVGLDSIMSLEVKTRLQSDLSVEIPAKLLLQAPSMRDAAAAISALRPGSSGASG